MPDRPNRLKARCRTMTNIEAIKYLEYLQDNYTRKGAMMCQAIDTAIAALKPKPIQTNGDRIRQMTDEELAKIMRSCKFCAYLDKGCQHNGTCTQGFLEWLKQEVD